MFGECADFLKRSGVHQFLNAFPCSELAGGVLLVDPVFATALHNAAALLAKFLEFAF
jgi:hypothetical protein